MTNPTDASSERGPQPSNRRRIDIVLDTDFLVGLESAEFDDVRTRRREAEQEEADLSYVRRMLQGRLDILRAELSRRSDASGSGYNVVDRLPDILADTSRDDHGMGRFLRVEPSRVDEHRRASEKVIADLGVSDVEGRSDEELAAALARVEDYERGVSADRRRVQQVMDELTAEVTRRYRTGAANVDDLLAGR